MSQTETLLLVVLGFALASLVALFVGRFAWSIALRRGVKRMQKQVPTTVKELQAERDRLRADYAMVSQKLGSHLETVKVRMAEQLAEVSRSRNRIQSLSEEVNARDLEIKALKDRVAALESELADKTNSLARLQTELSDSAAAVQKLEADMAEARTRAAATAIAMDEGLQSRIQKLTELSSEIAESRKAPADPTAPALPPDLDAKLAAAERETAELQQELARLDAAWSEKLKGLEASPAKLSDLPEPAVANVVSLANRIRSLQKDIAG